ncbi:YtxH-like protein [Filimonas lacunae]|uniref:YtxH-like protein n=1 Tax=Filimonas lacunae TaxID=477680 RepID=A0A173MRQ5_9BACT|nr:YtxH domain-containing protein [Filimonas lacunae]BAV10332.1 hypothetical protein FLA_6394 [Filimonas lacunae]SIT16955.1 YtxH-like protein [Filimonas lacunae]
MTSNQKFLAGIVLGAAAGALVTLFLNSDKGKALLEDVKDIADDAKDNIAGMSDEVTELVKKGKKFVQDLGSQAKEATL